MFLFLFVFLFKLNFLFLLFIIIFFKFFCVFFFFFKCNFEFFFFLSHLGWRMADGNQTIWWRKRCLPRKFHSQTFWITFTYFAFISVDANYFCCPYYAHCCNHRCHCFYLTKLSPVSNDIRWSAAKSLPSSSKKDLIG